LVPRFKQRLMIICGLLAAELAVENHLSFAQGSISGALQTLVDQVSDLLG